MSGWWLASYILLWATVLFLAFLLLGALRTQGLYGWRLEQLELITPSGQGRGGLKPGTKAPDFILPNINGSEVGCRRAVPWNYAAFLNTWSLPVPSLVCLMMVG